MISYNYEGTNKEKRVPIKIVLLHANCSSINLNRGVIITTTKAVAPEAPGPFGTASFHENDYPLYYFNIKANAAARIAAYQSK